MDQFDESAQRAPPGPRGLSVGRLRRTVRLLPKLASIPQTIRGRRADFLLFAVTFVELVIVVRQTVALAVEDWVYLSQHVLVLVISLTRRPAVAQNRSWPASLAVAISYVYPYAQVIYLDHVDGHVAWPAGGIALTTFSAFLSLAALLSMGRLFGVRPALRGLTTNGPYRLVRHPMYLAYVIGDIGYQLDEWNAGTVLLVIAGWTSLVYRIRAEEQVLSLHPDWAAYVRKAPYRLVPGVW